MFITGEQLSLFLPFTGKTMFLTFSYRLTNLLVSRSWSENRIAPGTDAHPWFSLTVTWHKHGCQQPALGDQRQFQDKGDGGLGAGPNTPKVFVLDGNFMRVLKASLRAALGTSVFTLIKIAQQALPSEDCPVLPLLSKYSQCVNSVSSSYTFTLPGHPLKEVVLILQSSR